MRSNLLLFAGLDKALAKSSTWLLFLVFLKREKKEILDITQKYEDNSTARHCIHTELIRIGLRIT
jgi:hypothetical protein